MEESRVKGVIELHLLLFLDGEGIMIIIIECIIIELQKTKKG